jgi:PilZ domain
MAVDDSPTRREQRIEILGELQGEVMVYEPMAITEISRGGAQIETSFPLQIDSLHDFRLMLGDRSVVVKGRIVHAHVCDVEDQATIYRAGVEFVQPSERIIEAIGEFMEAIIAGRART